MFGICFRFSVDCFCCSESLYDSVCDAFLFDLAGASFGHSCLGFCLGLNRGLLVVSCLGLGLEI